MLSGKTDQYQTSLMEVGGVAAMSHGAGVTGDRGGFWDEPCPVFCTATL